VSAATKRIFPTDITAVSAPAPVHVKTPDANEVKSADVQNGGAADGTRLPQPAPRAPLPPGQGTRIDQLV
jgi:hypothetical protein